MEHREKWWEGVDWIHLPQHRDCCEHSTDSSNFLKGGEFL